MVKMIELLLAQVAITLTAVLILTGALLHKVIKKNLTKMPFIPALMLRNQFLVVIIIMIIHNLLRYAGV
jgi:hypothetical protein